MEQRLSLVTLGVRDLPRARAFYEALGWRGQEVEEKAGAVVTRPASDTPYGGYAGVFTDPDGHPWEVSWNPGFPIAEDGSTTVPASG
ncbi:VOC family protein [Aquipuribacter sp. MA13-6]|uniref:VOC family protein n=1 Tax=unclassified Aquipuribacter TaxID=2635084 RepID=UPI003EE96125